MGKDIPRRELNPLLSLGHLCLSGVLHRTEVPPTLSPPHSQRRHLQILSYSCHSVPCSCSSSPWHVPKQGWGRQDSLGPSRARHWSCATGQPWPPSWPLLCPGPCLLSCGCTMCVSWEQILSSWLGWRSTQGSDIPECGAEFMQPG